MIVFDITGSEHHPIYRDLEVSNAQRHYDFLRSMVLAAIATNRPFLSAILLKSLNFHAIACLHPSAGLYRPCQVTVGQYTPPLQFRVGPLMDDLINSVNRSWSESDPVILSCYTLWKINHIHPFVNGNGRTARAAAYFILCVSLGSWLPGSRILPELLHRERDEYVAALKHADITHANGALDLTPLRNLVTTLLIEQLRSAYEEAQPEPAEDEAGPQDDALVRENAITIDGAAD